MATNTIRERYNLEQRLTTTKEWKSALAAAHQAATNHITQSNRANFVAVGGAALIFHGIDRPTDDLDMFGDEDTILEFAAGALNDKRFRRDNFGVFYFDHLEDEDSFTVKIDFLQGGDVIDSITSPKSFQGRFVASLQDLAIQKAIAYRDRSTTKDLIDFSYIIATMDTQRESFSAFEIDGETREAMRNAARASDARTKIVPALERVLSAR
ncbi:hypothetical protein TWF718_001159 [Orbilia javanica]|uniref:Uncharacterized protein n=1 Tax=Orbilia javanica TaxID=47235 RepID=A0AAN8RN45_9PEZI